MSPQDIHRDNTPEALAIINFSKNIMLYSELLLN